MPRRTVVFQPAGLNEEEKRALRRAVWEAEHELPEHRSTRRERSLPEAVVPGPFGPGLVAGNYWNLARPSIPPHQATSQHIAGIYPFVADAGLGSRGPIVGVDVEGRPP